MFLEGNLFYDDHGAGRSDSFYLSHCGVYGVSEFVYIWGFDDGYDVVYSEDEVGFLNVFHGFYFFYYVFF